VRWSWGIGHKTSGIVHPGVFVHPGLLVRPGTFGTTIMLMMGAIILLFVSSSGTTPKTEHVSLTKARVVQTGRVHVCLPSLGV